MATFHFSTRVLNGPGQKFGPGPFLHQQTFGKVTVELRAGPAGYSRVTEVWARTRVLNAPEFLGPAQARNSTVTLSKSWLYKKGLGPNFCNSTVTAGQSSQRTGPGAAGWARLRQEFAPGSFLHQQTFGKSYSRVAGRAGPAGRAQKFGPVENSVFNPPPYMRRKLSKMRYVALLFSLERCMLFPEQTGV